MKSNWKELDYYHAEFSKLNDKNFVEEYLGCKIKKDGKDIFTIELANELIEKANKAYKEKYGKDVDFNYVKLDMTNIVEDTENILDDGVSHPRREIGKTRVGKYDKRKNILRIWEDDVLVYENNNGKICKDVCALADSLM